MTTASAETELAVTVEDVAALRLADSVVLQLHEGVAGLRAYLRGGYGDEPRVYTRREQLLFPNAEHGGERSRSMVCQGAVRGCDTDGSWWAWRDAPNVACFAVIYAGIGDGAAWDTVAGLLRAGDTLTLSWLAGNDAGLFLDKVSLVVARGKRRLVFPLVVAVTPENTARMIRRHG